MIPFAVLHCTAGDALIALAALSWALVLVGAPHWPAAGLEARLAAAESRLAADLGRARICREAAAALLPGLDGTQQRTWRRWHGWSSPEAAPP